MKKFYKILIGLMIIFLFLGAWAKEIQDHSDFVKSNKGKIEDYGDFNIADIDPPKKPYSLANLVIELQNVSLDQNDTDGDGLYDAVEAVLGTNFENTDSDFDNLNDSYEIDIGLDPLNPDTNEDGLPDYYEIVNVYSLDIDSDGDPNTWDFDNDGDGVNDRLDLSPGAKSTVHTSFTFDITTDQKPIFITFQLRPNNAAHLKLLDQSWDWPWDNESTMQDLDNSKEDVFMAPWLRVDANDTPNQTEVEDYGMVITSTGMEVSLSPNREHGSIKALTGRIYHPSPPASLSLDIELLWKVFGLTDKVAKAVEAPNGNYVTIGNDSIAIATTTEVSDGMLSWIDLGSNNVALKLINGPYLSVADDGTVVANGTAIGNRETFEVEYTFGNYASFKAFNNNYLDLRGDDVLIADSIFPVEFVVHDLGSYPEFINLVTYNDDFMITGLTIEESFGSDMGVFYSSNKNQTIAANLIMDYIFLRNATTTIWDMPTMLTDYNVTVSNRTESFVEKIQAIIETGNLHIPEILSMLPANETLPIILGYEDNSKVLDLSDITSGSYIIGDTNLINLTAEPITTQKSMKLNFHNTSSKKLIMGGYIMLEIDRWGLDANTTLDLKTLIWKWNLGQVSITKEGMLQTNFTEFQPESEIENCTTKIGILGLDILGTTFTSAGMAIIETKASTKAEPLYIFLEYLTEYGLKLTPGGQKWSEFNYLSELVADTLILESTPKYIIPQTAKTGFTLIDVIPWMLFYNFTLSYSLVFEVINLYETEICDRTYGHDVFDFMTKDLEVYAVISQVWGLLSLSWLILSIGIGLGLFTGILWLLGPLAGIGAVVGSLFFWIKYLWVGVNTAFVGFWETFAQYIFNALNSLFHQVFGMGEITDYFHAEPVVEIEGNIEPTIIDKDENGLDVGDRIEILTHLVGIIRGEGENRILQDWSYIIPWIDIDPPSGSDSTTNPNIYMGNQWDLPDTTPLLNRTSVDNVNSTQREDRYDSMAWIEPGIGMRNFPVKLQFNVAYNLREVWYHKLKMFNWLEVPFYKCWHSQWNYGSTYFRPTTLTTLYYDVFPGTLDRFLGWRAITRNDRDGDGLNNSVELAQGVSDVKRYDTDADGLNDKYEIDIGTDPAYCDTDEDGLIDKYEFIYGTNATNGDSDGDGINDYLEIVGWVIAFNYSGQIFEMRVFSNPTLNDTDWDGFSDGDEYWSGLNPRSQDTDGDGTKDVATPQVEIIAILQNITSIETITLNSTYTISEFAVDNDGSVYLPVSIPGNNGSMIKLHTNLTYSDNWTLDFSPGIVGIDRAKELIFIESEGSTGEFWNFTLVGVTQGMNNLTDSAAVARGIAIDSSGFIYTSQEGTVTQISRFFPNGTYIEGYGSAGPNPEQFKKIGAIAVDEKYGFIYVLDGDGVASTQRIMKFNKTDGSFIATLPNGYGKMVDITTDSDGWVYILDQFDPEMGEGCVRKFDQNGMEDRNFILTDTNGTQPWMLVHYPLRIEVGSDKNIYILENKTLENPNPKILKFKPNVTLIPPPISNNKYDWDGDGLGNLREVVGWNVSFVNNGSVTTLTVNSEYLTRDTDFDGLNDFYENLSRTNPQDPDTDGDGLSDFYEWRFGTNLTNDDTDGDGLSDSDEIMIGSDPISLWDTDSDGLLDVQEFWLNSDPTKNDTDDDRASDFQEVLGNSSLLDPDTDDDFMLDGMDYALLCDPNDRDTDDDGLTDGEEIIYGTNPTLSDTDGDGAIDGLEVELWLDPLDNDTDDDGLLDWAELYWGTNPMNNDTDFDGIPDGLDNDTQLAFDAPIVVAFDPDPYNNSLQFAQNLNITTNVTIVSVDELLTNHTNASHIILVGRPAPENDTVSGLIYDLLADTGSILSEMMAPDSDKLLVRHGVWTSCQTVIIVSQVYPLDAYKVFSSVKAKNVTILPNSVLVKYKTTPILHNTTAYNYGFELDEIDTVKTTDAIFSVVLGNWSRPTIQLTRYDQDTVPHPLEANRGLKLGEMALGKYLEVTMFANGSTLGTFEEAIIIILIRPSDLDLDGNGYITDPWDLSESDLNLFYFDETTGSWIKLTTDLSWVLDIGVNTTDFELYGESFTGYIWARVTHLSLFTAGGLQNAHYWDFSMFLVLLALIVAGAAVLIYSQRRKLKPIVKKIRRRPMDNIEWEMTDKTLVLKFDITKEFGESRSGKTIIVANSHGGWHFKGTIISLGMIAYKYPTKKDLKPKKKREMQNIQFKLEEDSAILTIDTTKDFGLSSTGKSHIVASSRGNYHIEGTTIYIGINVYKKIRQASMAEPKEVKPVPKSKPLTKAKTKPITEKKPPAPKKPVTKPKDKEFKPIDATQPLIFLKDIPGVGPAKIKLLNQGNIFTIKDLINCDPKKVASEVTGLGIQTLNKWINQAKELIST